MTSWKRCSCIEISWTHCTMPAPVSSFKWWRNGIFGQIRCSYYTNISNILKMNKNAFWNGNSVCIGKFDFIIFEMQFLQLFKRLYPQKAFWRRLISGFYLSCQKIILNSTGNLKLFWLIKIGSKISPWLFLSFLRWFMIEQKTVWRCPFMTKNRPLFKKTLLLR